MDQPISPAQVLSIQPHVSYGHVGNAAAVFTLQRLGIEAWPNNTVHFSNHTGYDGWRGTRATAQEVADLILGVSERGLLSRLDAVLSGYLGSAAIAEVVGDTVASARSANPQVSYCLDPVIGAAGRGLYAAPDTAAAIKHILVPAADIITPNQFELEFLTDHNTNTTGDLLAAADDLRGRGPRVVLITSVHTEDTPPGEVDVYCVTDEATWRVRTPKRAIAVGGTGDVAAALFLGHLLGGASAPESLTKSIESVFDLLTHTEAVGGDELLLVAAQHCITSATKRFVAKQVR